MELVKPLFYCRIILKLGETHPIIGEDLQYVSLEQAVEIEINGQGGNKHKKAEDFLNALGIGLETAQNCATGVNNDKHGDGGTQGKGQSDGKCGQVDRAG